MKNIILFDDDKWDKLLPLTYTRPIGGLRIGIDTIAEKWQRTLNGRVSYITRDFLSQKYPIHIAKGENLLIAGHILPTPKLVMMLENLDINQALLYNDSLIAAKIEDSDIDKIKNNEDLFSIKGIDLTHSKEVVNFINNVTDIFSKNDQVLREDFTVLTQGKISASLSSTNTLIGDPSNLFIEEGAKIEACIINCATGPVYIGRNVTIMEGSMIRGPFSALDNCTIKMGAKIYGATSLGPMCVIGGEVNNVVIQGYSNKAHEGYLGNAVLGEWCNIGADTNASNLKNNYEEVKIWSYSTEKFEKTGLIKVGLIMGDHSKTGINTMFNTGTTVGIHCNVFGDGYPRVFIPSFSFGGASGFTSHILSKAISTAETVMKLRGFSLEEHDIEIFKAVFEYSSKYRAWEKHQMV